MYKNDRYVSRYSESFKLKVLPKLTKGNIPKTNCINLRYKIQYYKRMDQKV